MQFPKMFQRRVGMGATPAIVLGEDAAPTNAGYLRLDNTLSTRGQSINGFPLQRIAVGYKGPANALNQTANLYLWDETSEGWYKLNAAAVTLKPNQLAWFDIAALVDSPVAGMISSPGAVDVALVVTPPGNDPDGTHTFIIGGDISNA